MQSINLTVTNSILNNSFYPSYVANINSRIDKNRAFLEDLKDRKPFQELLFLMRGAHASFKHLLDLLIGKASLEECLGKTWRTNLLVKTYGELEVSWFNSHFLPGSITLMLYDIFKPSYFESAEKSQLKMCALMGAIERKDSFKMFDFAGTDLSGIDLSGANLCTLDWSGANLSKVNLNGAFLRRANLSMANLTGADLSGAYLHEANLSGANLACADLYQTQLFQANLSGADLSEANLSSVNLEEANLSGANLSEVNLSCAYLNKANLFQANLSKADLRSIKICTVQLLHAKLTGAQSNDCFISNMIKKQERKEAAVQKYQLLSQMVGEFTFDGTYFPKELINIIGCDLL